MIEVPVSWGELIDKITILEIKSARIDDPTKLANIRRELDLLTAKLDARTDAFDVRPLMDSLRDVNRALWEIEDEIRGCEDTGDFGKRFVELARSVYFTNDKRADLKRQINKMLASDIVEEKSYRAYKVD
jgi:hypothetical protein